MSVLLRAIDECLVPGDMGIHAVESLEPIFIATLSSPPTHPPLFVGYGVLLPVPTNRVVSVTSTTGLCCFVVSSHWLLFFSKWTCCCFALQRPCASWKNFRYRSRWRRDGAACSWCVSICSCCCKCFFSCYCSCDLWVGRVLVRVSVLSSVPTMCL
jgi:hypothetical protein